MSFKLLELTPIARGGLLGRARLQMPSGLIIVANIIRGRKDPSKIYVFPPAERQQGGNYVQLIDFATKELRDQWQAAALAAVEPRLDELLAATAPREEASTDGYCPF